MDVVIFMGLENYFDENKNLFWAYINNANKGWNSMNKNASTFFAFYSFIIYLIR